jgi:hypothetical protein
MEITDWIVAISAGVSAVLTGIYAFLTWKIVGATKKQVNIMQKQIVSDIEFNILNCQINGFDKLRGETESYPSGFNMEVVLDVFNKNNAGGSFTNPILELSDKSKLLLTYQLVEFSEKGSSVNRGLGSMYVKGGEIKRISLHYTCDLHNIKDASIFKAEIHSHYDDIVFSLNYKTNLGESKHLVIDKGKIKGI